MATWVIHFRVADMILDALPVPDRDAFILGSVAPDSGSPSADGLRYLPDKSVSHFYTQDTAGQHSISLTFFDRTCLCQPFSSDRQKAFLLGYYAHLITDVYWVQTFLAPEKQRLADLYQRDKAGFYRLIKRDWYDADFIYLAHHPELPAFLAYRSMPDITNHFMPIFAPDAFARRREAMCAFYDENVPRVTERKTSPSAEALNRFVDETGHACIQMLSAYL